MSKLALWEVMAEFWLAFCFVLFCFVLQRWHGMGWEWKIPRIGRAYGNGV